MAQVSSFTAARVESFCKVKFGPDSPVRVFSCSNTILLFTTVPELPAEPDIQTYDEHEIGILHLYTHIQWRGDGVPAETGGGELHLVADL